MRFLRISDKTKTNCILMNVTVTRITCKIWNSNVTSFKHKYDFNLN